MHVGGGIMKKKIFTALAIGALCLPLGLGLAGCGGKSSDVDVVAKDVYAMSAVSSVMYLDDLDAEAGAQNETTRPSHFTDDDVQGVKNYLEMFNGMLIGNGLEQDVINTPSDDKYSGVYNFCMTISVPSVGGETVVYKMYYNEINKETKEEIDDGELELEVSSTLDGVLVFGDEEYEVHGEREFEKEGREEEASIEFTTRSRTNRRNYIVVEQSVENDEIEYEYKIYQNGRLVSETEVEMERERNHTEFELQFKDNGALKAGVYRMYKRDNDDTFVIDYIQNNVRDQILATISAEGVITFTYSNGYIETF